MAKQRQSYQHFVSSLISNPFEELDSPSHNITNSPDSPSVVSPQAPGAEDAVATAAAVSVSDHPLAGGVSDPLSTPAQGTMSTWDKYYADQVPTYICYMFI